MTESFKQPLYGNPLSSFENGVQFDLRAKLAIEFIKTPHLMADLGVESEDEEALSFAQLMAKFAFDLAEAVLEQADQRGYLRALPETDELSSPLKRHIRANIRAGVFQQFEQQKIMAEEAPRVTPGGAIPPGANGAVR